MTHEPSLRPGFVAGFEGGNRFVLTLAPAPQTPARGVILCLPAFLDEGNLTRRVIVEQARRLAPLGWTVLIPDLYGCGDSAGATADARWPIWQADLRRWARLADALAANRPLVVWGIRMGALLAAELSQAIDRPHHLLLWQAPASGRALIDPLRKLSLLADRAAADPKVAAAKPALPVPAQPAPAQAAPAGEALAGYQLDPTLLSDLQALACTPPAQAQAGNRVLFAHTQRVIRDDQPIPPALQKLIDSWQQQGWDTQAAVVAGEPFWASMEPSTPSATFEATEAWLAGLASPPAAAALPDQSGAGTLALHESQQVAEVSEQAIVLAGSQGALIGILTRPASSSRAPRAAMLIVPGQPQTRTGSHRMFVEQSRWLAGHGIASLRFDVGGWGDSPGLARAFEQSCPDIAIAAGALRERTAAPGASPDLWLAGLCDGASAALLALPTIRRGGHDVSGVLMINPWVRSEASLGQAMIKSYYAKRLLDPDLWKRLLSGRISVANLVADPLRHLRASWKGARRKPAAPPPGPAGASAGAPAAGAPASASAGAPAAGAAANASTGAPAAGAAPANAPVADLPGELLQCLEAFRGQVVTLLSGADLTAAEAESLMARDPRWKRALDGRRSTLIRIEGADHTFSRPEHWRQALDAMARV
ncbi:MAG: alpha/beta hydrolase [Burkholderiaceae bacterium]|nr:alpha/beta hydrolase [Burkholderiaceae bacterium]